MERRRFLAIAALAPLLAAADGRPRHRLVVHKARRRMELWVGGRRVRTLSVGLGFDPIGDKAREGDGRTPEGEFYIAWKKPNSDFHRFLGLSYPMPRHARRAVDAKLISRAEASRVDRRVRIGGTPPQTSKLGGFVGIHGGGSGTDWTLGCIAVSDAEIEVLFEEMRVGDVVEVRP